MSRSSLHQQSKADFDEAYFRGFIRSVDKWLGRNKKTLIAFNEILKHLSIKGQYDAGLQEIEINKIIGSVNRYADFDDAFLPRQRHTRSRWEKIDRAYLKDEILPPVDVYQIGEFFFVIDGNHRISVARKRGQHWIDAHVIKIDVPYEIGKDFDFNRLILKEEQTRFYEKTGIQDLYPAADIEMTIPGLFDRLREHIDAHKYYTSEYLQKEISYSEAVASWYEYIYLPLVNIIQEKDILSQFPDRTESDLYFWIIEHLAYLKADYQQDFSFEEATDDFKRRFRPNFFSRFLGKLRKTFQRTKR